MPHIKDVTRRMALEGFVALAPDYPVATSAARRPMRTRRAPLFPQLTPADVAANGVATIAYLKTLPKSNGKVGAIGFCWGGGTVNNLAVASPDLLAAVPYYGVAAARRRRAKIKGTRHGALRRARRAHQRRHSGVRGSAEGGRRRLPDLRLRGRQPRLQQRHLGGALRARKQPISPGSGRSTFLKETLV